MSSRGTNIIRSYDRVGWLVIFFHSLSLSLSFCSSHLTRSTWRAWAFVAFHYVVDAIFRKSMPHNTHRCQIKRFWYPLAMWESWHRCAHRPTCINKSNQLHQPLTLPNKCFLLPQSSLSHASVFSLHELIWHRSKVGDLDWGTRWEMEGHRCQMQYKWIWHVWPT